MTNVTLVNETEFHVVAVGPVQVGGGGGGIGEIFVLDVTPTTTGLVGNKTYVDGVELDACLSDTNNVRVWVGCEGGTDKYKPSVTINGIAATLTESSTKRWFTGYADIVAPNGVSEVLVVSDAGGTDTATIEVLGPGPAVLSVTFGPYPGTQTELKAGDSIQVIVNTDLEATGVLIDGLDTPVLGGVAMRTLAIGSGNGPTPVVVRARNSFGTYGASFESDPLNLNQTYPTFGTLTVTYPGGKQALDAGDSGSVSCTVTNADTMTYSSPDVTIDSPNVYAVSKAITNHQTGYINGALNYTITANRAANNATATKTGSIKIATIPATASITTSPAGRMVSSPAGTSYSVRVTPSQALASAPSLTSSVGTWSGSWTLVGAYWQRALVIKDTDARGVGTFSGLTITSLTNIAGSTITSGAAYIVGGFSSRTVTFPAFSRVAPIGATVADVTKLSASISGTSLTRYTDNAQHSSGFYPANADGSYNATGTYMGLSDSLFAGSNTTGTLQATIQETA